ncbi:MULTISPECIES: hypothetical protein [Bifidobacterium]|jgi:hypothetical protein|uniref:hypothetical protein n=1 Tax=Bifidobacterium TaxID=1678 RepID=UPI0006BF810F|nr:MULTISPECIES: hypothetical protein [Bifidobacterium]UVY53925.1 MAG: hypothetical protein [Bacteriophage sp.]DAG07067.1 MAG TPA: hypothetical protein [Caudoviricetes sp.]MCB4870170.1 hypothetical protein [Bifidobacterium pseudocatenulatum]MCO7148543.1 hypothetical protein [Bifidobacterium longum]CUN99648.1 Uncharacterised protein [Bifidobacterium pseudocatenulatum]
MASWNTPLPNIPETDYGPAFEPTIIAAIKELRAAIDGQTTPAAPTVDALGGATDIGKNILKARDAAAVRTLLNVAEKPAA